MRGEGGHAWLLGGHEWVPEGGCAWLPGGYVWLLGGMHDCQRGGCAWLLGGMHGEGGRHGERGVCVVRGWVCVVKGGMRGIQRDTEIRSMSGRYASYWNAFLFVIILCTE